MVYLTFIGLIGVGILTAMIILVIRALIHDVIISFKNQF